MTERGLFEATLMEIRKVKAPHIHIEDFNYFANKSIQEYINEQYNVFETTQQTTDALNSITSYVNYKFNYNGPATTVTISGNTLAPSTVSYITGERYKSKFSQVNLPQDYFHLLNCVTDVETKFNYKCYPAGFIHSGGTKKLNADSASNVMSNAWLKPAYNRTFYKFLDHANVNSVNTTQANNNNTAPDIQVYYGPFDNKFRVNNIYVEYLRKPRVINLTQLQIDSPLDTSNLMDFTDYVCNEIVKRMVKLVLENSKDPRLNTFIPVNNTVK